MLDNTNDDLGRSTVESRSSWKSLQTNRLLLALLTVSLVTQVPRRLSGRC